MTHDCDDHHGRHHDGNKAAGRQLCVLLVGPNCIVIRGRRLGHHAGLGRRDVRDRRASWLGLWLSGGCCGGFHRRRTGRRRTSSSRLARACWRAAASRSSVVQICNRRCGGGCCGSGRGQLLWWPGCRRSGVEAGAVDRGGIESSDHKQVLRPVVLIRVDPVHRSNRTERQRGRKSVEVEEGSTTTNSKSMLRGGMLVEWQVV